jgi:hypothetical protein
MLSGMPNPSNRPPRRRAGPSGPPGSIRERRNAAGYTIRELEEATGINRGRLSVIERGVVPEPEEAAAIEEALGRPGPHADHTTPIVPLAESV